MLIYCIYFIIFARKLHQNIFLMDQYNKLKELFKQKYENVVLIFPYYINRFIITIHDFVYVCLFLLFYFFTAHRLCD